MSVFPITQPPLTLGGLQFWIDSNDPAGDGSQPSNDSNLITWIDKSGHQRNFTQAIGAQQPIFKTNILAGKPSVLFSGDQWMDTPSFAWNNDEATIFVVAHQPVGTEFPQLITGNNNFQIDFQTTLASIQVNNVTVGDYSINAGFAILSLVRKSGDSKLYFNGVQSGSTNTMALSNIATSPYTVGTRGDRAVPLEGYVSELIAYNGVLSSTERQLIEKYLSNKWGISA